MQGFSERPLSYRCGGHQRVRAGTCRTPKYMERNSFRGNELGFRDRHFTRAPDGYRLADSVRARVHFEQAIYSPPRFCRVSTL